MRVSLCIRIDGFYARVARESVPSLQDEPLVVHGSGTVIDADAQARHRGVIVGMPTRQARALIQNAGFVEIQKDRYQAASREWLDLLVPFSGTIEPLDHHEAAVDLSDHPRPCQIAEAALEALRVHHPGARAGLGRSKWTARIAMVHGGDALEDPAAFLAPLPIAALMPASARAREKLTQLGYGSIAEAQEVPFPILARQFGKEALTLHQAIHGRLGDRVEAAYPPGAAHGYRPFEGGTSSLEDLAKGLDALAGDVGERLAMAERETTSLRLHVEHEASVLTLARTFAKPIRDARTLRCALALMVEGKVAQDVYGLRVTLPDLVASDRSQSGLFVERTDDRARLERETARLRSAFGERAVVSGSEVVLPRRRLVLRELGGLVGWR